MVAVALERQGRFDEAVAGYQKAIKIDPAMPVCTPMSLALQSDAYGRLRSGRSVALKRPLSWIRAANEPAGSLGSYLDLGDDKRAEQWLTAAR